MYNTPQSSSFSPKLVQIAAVCSESCNLPALKQLSSSKHCMHVLVLAGIELIFFIVGGMGLWVGFVLEPLLTTQGCFHYWKHYSACSESRPILLLTSPYQQAGWRCTKTWQGTQLGELPSTNQKDITYYRMLSLAYKAGGRREEGCYSALSSPGTDTCAGCLSSLGGLNTCLPKGSGD